MDDIDTDTVVALALVASAACMSLACAAAHACWSRDTTTDQRVLLRQALDDDEEEVAYARNDPSSLRVSPIDWTA